MSDLHKIRNEIDSIDRKILSLLAKRLLCAEKIAAKKKCLHLPVFDSSREDEIFQRIKDEAVSLEIPQDMVTSIFKEIIHQSSRLQEKKLKESI